jgi:hypothetical protein
MMIRKLFWIFTIVVIVVCSSMPVFGAEDVIFYENFNGPCPGAWYIYSNYTYGWAWFEGYAHNYCDPSTGTYYYYNNNLYTYMQRQNIDLTGYDSASLSFNFAVDTEESFDFFEVWVKDSNGSWHIMYYDSGPVDPLVWRSRTIDLTQFVGQNGITIDFTFESDGSVAGVDGPYAGAYLDNVVLTGFISPLVLTSPNGGESWRAGTRRNITWGSGGEVGNVKIEVSTNNKSSWTTVISSTANDGTHSWLVPNTPSAQCFIKISEAADGDPSDVSDSAFTILPQVKAINLTSPNGGENWTAGSTHNITWTTTGTVGKVKIEYSIDNGSNWSEIIDSTTNDGSHSWTVPNTPSTECLVKISEVSDSDLVDFSESTFAILPPFVLNSPNGGETWEAGSVHKITWTANSTVQNVKLEYSDNSGSADSWTLIAASAPNNGTYNWTIPNILSSKCVVRISDPSNSSLFDTSDEVFSITKGPEISLNRTYLNYGALTNGIVTDGQTFLVANTGGGTLSWSVSDNVAWLFSSTESGTNDGVVTVYANASGLPKGIYTGIINVSAGNASNSPQSITVTLNVKNPSNNEKPFGTFETPQDKTTVMSSIAVTGWVLDDIQVESVKIYRKAWIVDPGGDGYWSTAYVGDAIFVEGARPDVEQSYSGYPLNYQAGWGYMMLTNFLPNGGNGTFIISAIARDKAGKDVTLGEKTIYCDNKNAVKPFGAIDTPAPGGIAAGGSYRNTGWALTPIPNKIPEDGKTISVYVDGVNLGHPTYNIYRKDIAGYFPGYANSNGAHGVFDFDTTRYDNGIHTIQWVATDSAGNTDGIGSRFFKIQNTGSSSARSSEAKQQGYNPYRSGSILQFSGIPVNFADPVLVKQGFNQDIQPEILYPDENGTVNIETRELERIEIQFSDISANESPRPGIVGFQIIGDRYGRLPVGSTVDARTRTFYWSLAPGFSGEYQLVFVDEGNQLLRKININILPRYSKEESLSPEN